MANVPSSRTIGSISSTYYNSGINEDVDYTITFYLITSYTQSAANNTTTVSMHIRAVPSPSVPYMVGSWSVTGTGGTKSGGETSFASGTKNFSSSSKTLTHTTSGTCSFSSGATLSVSYYTTIPGSKTNKQLFKTLTLSNKSYSVPSFNVYSTLSFNTTSPTMLTNCVMTISKAAVATSGVRIKATYDGADHTIYTGSANSYTWTVPDLHLTTPNSTKKAITITIQSVKGSTYYAAKTYTINAVVPAEYVPNVWISDITDNIGWSQFVAGWSALSVEMQGGTSDSVTTLTAYSMEVRQDDSSGNLIYSGSKSSSELIETLSMNTPIVSPTTWIKATVTDSRGRKGTAETTVSAVNYQQPQISLSASRCDSLGNLDPIGNYILVQVSWSITQVGSDNFVTSDLVTQLSTNGGPFVTVDSQTISGYSGTYTFVTALGAQYGGQLQASLSDNLTTTISNIKSVSRASIPLSLYDDGVDLGVTMGGIASAGGFRCLMDAYFAGALDFSNSIVSEWFRFQAGETYEVGNDAFFAGLITSSGNNLVFSLMLPRSAEGRTVTVTALTLNARAGGQYVGGSDYNFLMNSTVSVEIDSYDGRNIKITCNKSGGWGIANNTIALIIPSQPIALSFS